MFERIEEKKNRLDQKRPIPPHTLKNIKEHLLLDWAYNSNAIEGNTLTLSETKVAFGVDETGLPTDYYRKSK